MLSFHAMPQLSLNTIKILAIICIGVSFIIAVTLIINGIVNRQIWVVNSPILGARYWTAFDFTIGVGVSIIIVITFGGVAIALNGYGMLILYIGLLTTLMIVDVVGMVFVLISPWETNLKLLEGRARQLTPEQLAPLERNFHCCGIEKYTDYFMIWKLFTDKERPSRKEISKLYPGPLPNVSRTTKDLSWWGKKSLETKKSKLDRARGSWKKKLPGRHRNSYGIKTVKKRITHLVLENKRYVHATARFRYEPDSIYSGIRKYLKGLFGVDDIIGYVLSPFAKALDILQNLTTWIWGTFREYYRYYIPEIIRDIILGFLGSILWWSQMFWRRLWDNLQWWRGSGWDSIFWKYVMPTNGPLLPFSCCKMPQLECTGGILSTWPDGCIYMLHVQWNLHTGGLVSGLGTYIVTSFVNIGSNILLVMCVRDKYYF